MRFTALILTALAASASLAQSDPALERIEQGYEDVSPLATSLEQYNHELRQPAAFDTVYRVPGTEGVLMRRNGALHALFERSEYIPTRFGDLAVPPAGTIYSIGPPSDSLLATFNRGPRSLMSAAGAPAPHTSSLRVSNRIEAQAPAEPPAPRSLTSAAPNAWRHEAERLRRLDHLFAQLQQDSSNADAPTDD